MRLNQPNASPWRKKTAAIFVAGICLVSVGEFEPVRAVGDDELQAACTVDNSDLPRNLRIVLEAARPLMIPRGKRLPLYVLPITDALRGIDDRRAAEVLRQLDSRGIALTVDWHPGNRETSLAEGLRIAALQKQLGLDINVNATACLLTFFDGDERTAHLDSKNQPFFDDSFAPEIKMGCPFALDFRYAAIREQVEFFLRGYSERKFPIDFIFADWEIDGPIEWNGAWDCSKRCRRCRERIRPIDDFRTFQKELRLIRSDMQRVVFAETVLRYFPQARVGNYGVYPDDGYRYWYDYFEKPVEGAPFKSDQQARYREWFPEFERTKYTFAMPVVYTWYPIYHWYDFADPDYRWFYNMLLTGSTVAPHRKENLPIISFVHWTTTAPPPNPDLNVKQFSAGRYQELLRHLLLRGHDGLFLWCQEPELPEEIRLLHDVYADTLVHRQFLEEGKPVTFEVFSKPGPVISGVRRGEEVLVRRTDFGDDRTPVTLRVGGRRLVVPRAEGQWQILKLGQ